MIYQVMTVITVSVFVFSSLLIYFFKGPFKKYYLIINSICLLISLIIIGYIDFNIEPNTVETNGEFTGEVKTLLSICFILVLIKLLSLLIFFITKIFSKSRSTKAESFIKRNILKSKYIYFIMLSGIFSLFIRTILDIENEITPFRITQILFILGVVCLNLLIYGRQKATKPLIIFLLCLMSEKLAMILFTLDFKQTMYLYIISYMLLCIVGIIRPLFELLKKPENYSWQKLPFLLLVISFLSIGSITMPMKLSMNDITIVRSPTQGLATYQNNEKNLSNYEVCRKYQNENIFSQSKEPNIIVNINASCPAHVKQQLGIILKPEKYCTHVTFLFWLNQFIVNTSGMESLVGCKVSTLEPKQSGYNAKIATLYYWFINLILFGTLTGTILSMYKIVENKFNNIIKIAIDYIAMHYFRLTSHFEKLKALHFTVKLHKQLKPQFYARHDINNYISYRFALGWLEIQASKVNFGALRILNLIKALKNSFDGAKLFYSDTGSYQLFKIVQSVQSNVTPLYRESDETIVMEYKGYYFNINGLLHYSPSMRLMNNFDEQFFISFAPQVTLEAEL